jgi:hypothetical protein
MTNGPRDDLERVWWSVLAGLAGFGALFAIVVAIAIFR